MSALTPGTMRLVAALSSATGAPLFEASISLVTPSVANLREHFAQKAKRASAHRKAGYLLTAKLGPLNGRRLLVVLTRSAPRAVDDDNLASLLKNLRDGVADRLGIDDRDEAVVWHVQQEKGSPRVRVSVWRLGDA